MAVAAESVVVGLERADAIALWCDTSRWPTFIEGFHHTITLDSTWPEPGSTHVWESVPNGRGRVTERVIDYVPDERIVTEVFESALHGRQTVTFGQEQDKTVVAISLDYSLTRPLLVALAVDLLFVRRALGSSLARTLQRFAIESAEQAGM
jgi:uncharacterized membrane protein